MVVLRSLEEDLNSKVNLLQSNRTRTASVVECNCKHGSTITDSTFLSPRVVAIKKHCQKCSGAGGLPRTVSFDNFSKPSLNLNHSKVDLYLYEQSNYP